MTKGGGPLMSEAPEKKEKFSSAKGLKSLPRMANPGQKQKYEQCNDAFAKTNQEFQDACSKVDVKPTRRQASKWRRKLGKAYNEGRH